MKRLGFTNNPNEITVCLTASAVTWDVIVFETAVKYADSYFYTYCVSKIE